MMKWFALRGKDKREKVFNFMFPNIMGTGGYSDGDYVAIFHKRYNDYSFYILKYGVRTIFVRSWDESWFDVYNWNILLAVERPDGSMELLEDHQFLTYEEAQKILSRLFEEYPDKYFKGEIEEEDIEFPEWAESIVSQALQEATTDNIDEVKSKLSSTALCVDYRMLKKAFKLLEMKVRRNDKGKRG